MAVDELARPLPSVVRRLGVLLLLAVEEAVRRAVVRHDLVLDAGLGESTVERGVVVGGDVLVGAGLQCEDRRLDLRCPLDEAGPPPRARGAAVEADPPGEPVSGRRRDPGRAPAEAEAGRGDGGAAAPAPVPDRRTRAVLHAVVGRLVDVRHVLEVIVALRGARGPAEVV